MGRFKIDAAQDAVNSVASELLSKNGSIINGVTMPNDLVEIALVTFARTASTAVSPTTNLNTFKNKVNSLNANGGTNWEDALQEANGVTFKDNDPTYIIFVSDGNPTYYNNGNNVGGTGQESDSNIATSYNHAKDDAKAIVDAGKQFYAIGAYGNVSRMENLVDDAGAPAANYYSAADTDSLNAALNSIVSAITSTLGQSNVITTDGITALATTSVEGSTTNFRYYKGTDSNNLSEWNDAPEATVDENGNVVWDLTSVGALENGTHYVTKFDVWPTQEAYDLVADLMNGKITYNDDLKKKGIIEITNPDGSKSYTCKTNTTLTTEYNGITPGQEFDAGDFGMSVVPYLMSIEKIFRNNLDNEGSEQATLTMFRDGDEYDTYVLNGDNDYHIDALYVAPGLIRAGQVLDPGHEYTFEEDYTESNNWELIDVAYRPMIIDGTHKLLKRVDGAGDYTIGGKNYVVIENNTLTATNERRSNLTVKKEVTGIENSTESFNYTMSVNTDDESVTYEITRADGTIETDTVKSREKFTFTLKVGDELKILNVLTGTTYTVEESTTMPAGYTFDSVSANTEKTQLMDYQLVVKLLELKLLMKFYSKMDTVQLM